MVAQGDINIRVVHPSFDSATRSKPEKKIGCANCGKCCNFSQHRPFITATDMQNWLDKGLWHVIKRVTFIIGNGKDSKERTGEKRQEWSFQSDKNQDCIFRFNGKCNIYSVRPLACQVYPVGKKCQNGTLPACVNKHDLRAFLKAHKAWDRASDEWKQETLKNILRACTKHGLKVSNETVREAETLEESKARESL